MTPPATGLAPKQVNALVKSIYFTPQQATPECRISVAECLFEVIDGDASGFLQAVQAHRVASLIDSQAATLGLPEEIATQVHALAVDEAMLALALAKETLRASNCLTEAGLANLAFKGVALSMQSTGTVTSRGNGDIDLLVRPADVLAAAAALTAAGWELAEITPHRLVRDWRWIQWSCRELVLVGPRSQIDLHWQVAKERGLLPAAQMLLDNATKVEILGEGLPTLSQSDALLCACYHLSHDGFRSLRQCVDVIRLLLQQGEPVNWTGRERTMGWEAANFVVRLLGGVSAGQLAAIGIEVQQTSRANKRWTEMGCHPEFGYKIPGMRAVLDRIADNVRFGSLPVEVARRGVLQLAMRPGAHL